jgi:hypothetical protein
MKLRITSITTPEVGEQVNNVTTALEDRLRPFIESREYGGCIREFAVFFVSVDPDTLANERFCIANNRASRYKDILTGEIVRFVALAVPVDPAIVLHSSREALPGVLQRLLLDEFNCTSFMRCLRVRQTGTADLRKALLP